jgi:cobalt-zinc-cadmium efflux system outer membrane protein
MSGSPGSALARSTIRCMKASVACGFSALCIAGITVAAQAPSSLTLNEAIGRAVEANRAVLAARSARAIDLAARQAAGQRPNPEVSVEAERETPHWAFGSTVPIEVSGKRQRRLDVANATLAVTEAEAARVTADVRSDVRRAYYQVVAAVRRVDVAQELETIATRARDAAQDRFQTGAAPRLEALQAQLALSEVQNEAARAHGEISAARAELNALLAFPPEASPTLADPLEGGPLPSQQDATTQAITGNAELQVLQRQIEAERARVALARALRRPDPSVSGTLTYDAQPEFTVGWRAGVAIALPILTTGRADVAVAEATLNRAIADREARVLQVTGAVSAAVARAASARQAMERYQTDILPASVQVEQMAQESYQSGQTGLPALLQTVQAAREIRQRALQAGLDYQLALADLERAMGTPLR